MSIGFLAEPGQHGTLRKALCRRMAGRAGLGAGVVAVALVAAACGSTAASKPTTTSTAAAASGGSVVVKTAQIGKLGTVLVDSKGMTLYRYTLDHPPTIACTGACASIWPPLLVPSGEHVSGPTGLDTVTRPGGATQVAWHGIPLYTYVGDKAPGQAKGEGYTKTWYVCNALAKQPGSGSTTTSTSSSGGGY